MRLVVLDAFLLPQQLLQLRKRMRQGGVDVAQVGQGERVLLPQQPLVEHGTQRDVQLKTTTSNFAFGLQVEFLRSFL